MASYICLEPPSNEATPCPLRYRCELVKKGQCTNSHRRCWHGQGCPKLAKRQCTYFHPPEHFKSDILDEHKYPQNHLLDELHKYPKNHHKVWSRNENAIVLKFMNDYPKTCKKKDILAQLASALNHTRTPTAIRTRINVITDKINDTNHKPSPINEDDEETESDNDNNHNNHNNNSAKHIYSFLNQLIRYYKMDNNEYEINNIIREISKLKSNRFNGDKHSFKDIVGCAFSHFEDAFTDLERKYGVINAESEENIISTLKLTKEKLNELSNNMDGLITDLTDNHWFGQEEQFAEITGYDLEYFKGVLRAIDAPKITETNVVIKKEVTERDDVMNHLEQYRKNDIESVRIKKEDCEEDMNRNSDYRRDNDRRHRRRRRSRSRSRSRGYSKHRRHSRSSHKSGSDRRHYKC